MRLPFVPRGTLQAVQRLADVYEKLWAESMAREQKWADRHEALIAKLVEATRQPEIAKLPERTRDDVIEAILAKAGNNGQLRAHLSAYAAKARREQMPDDKIVQSILVWASPDEDDSSAGVL
jgi:hypothetical protein